MTDFLIWYFNLTIWQSVEFFAKALLLMILLIIPFIGGYHVYKYLTSRTQRRVIAPQFDDTEEEMSYPNHNQQEA